MPEIDQTERQAGGRGAGNWAPAPAVEEVIGAENRGSHQHAKRRRVPPPHQAALEKSAEEPLLDGGIERQVIGALHQQVGLGRNEPAAAPPGKIHRKAHGDRKTREAERHHQQQVADWMRGHQPEVAQRRARQPADD